uniref:Putative secreted protein n=1 Tax=Panstrongylus lignarius TaxID=156445 RepID=A0A224Y1S6_9HEMI
MMSQSLLDLIKHFLLLVVSAVVHSRNYKSFSWASLYLDCWNTAVVDVGALEVEVLYNSNIHGNKLNVLDNMFEQNSIGYHLDSRSLGRMIHMKQL